MPNVNVYNQEGTKTGNVDLNAAHFGVTVNAGLIHEAVVAQMANARQPVANTKARGEVRGGGKKPWRQKGTGRARHGSIRSPIWVGGGVTFGPRGDRNYSVKINKKAKRKALFMALSDKVVQEKLLVLESFKPAEVKTKALTELLRKLPIKKSVLYVIPASRPELVQMARNLDRIHVVTVNTLNLMDVLKYDTLLFESETVPAFETLFKNA
ncbi:50S ribosomal protein L4 [Candidatus Uhrbacteria bacterium]|nr:50S ribosomal protein L4 [Candidatus Uhrbacteria bacterium]MBD3284409.1 50S ribosomal protein L4 [Candidatus Uhrbacteria bacterium]